MDNTTIFTKTAKGVGEAVGKTRILSRDFRNILKEIDGNASLEELSARLVNLSEAKLYEALAKLAMEDYIREFVLPLDHETLDFSTILPPVRKIDDGDAGQKIQTDEIMRAEQAQRAVEQRIKNDTEKKLKREADKQARQKAEKERREIEMRQKAEEQALRKTEEAAQREAEARAKKEAEEQARHQAEAQVRREAEARVMQEAEEKARHETEARVKKDAEDQARRQAKEKSRREAEARAKKEAEEKVRYETEARAKKDAEEQARRQAEEQARRETEEKIRREAAAQAMKDAEEQTRRQAEEQARRETEEKIRREAAAQAMKDAEEQTRRQAEEQVRRETEEKIRREAAAQAMKDAEEQARRQAEEQARRETEEKIRREAAAQAMKDAEEQTRRQAEEQARRETEEKIRREAAAQAMKDAEEQARHQAEEQTRRETEARTQKAAEEKTRREAEARAVKEAQEQARREAKEQARRKAEEKSHREAEARAQKAVEEKARREAKQQAKRDAQEQTRNKAETHAKKKAEDLAQRKAQKLALKEAKEKSRQAENEQANKSVQQAAIVKKGKKVYRKPGKLGARAILGLFFLILVGLGLMHLIPFNGRIPLLEKTASQQFQQPVKINRIHLSLVPQPHWLLEGVSIGDNGQIRAPRIKANTELGALFSDRMVFKSIDIDSAVLNEEGLSWLLFGKSREWDFGFGRVGATNVKLDSRNIDLPLFNAGADIGRDGIWKKIVLDSVENKIHIELQPKNEAVQVELSADSFTVPFGSAVTLEKLHATGMAQRNELTVTDFKGMTHNGILAGNATLKLGAPWNLKGELSAKQMDTEKLMPELLQNGKLEGNAKYSLQAQHIDKLFAAPRLEGSFAIHNGILLGVDMANLLRNANSGGKFQFTQITGNFVHDSGNTQLRKMHLNAGLVSASGNADVDTNKNLSGRFVVDLKSPTMQARANLSVSGTLREPHFSR